MNKIYRTVLAGEDSIKSPDELTASNTFDRPEFPVTYLCWNEKNRRLGRTLNYGCAPDGKGDAQLSVLEYRDNHGRLIFWRYTKFSRSGGES